MLNNVRKPAVISIFLPLAIGLIVFAVIFFSPSEAPADPTTNSESDPEDARALEEYPNTGDTFSPRGENTQKTAATEKGITPNEAKRLIPFAPSQITGEMKAGNVFLRWFGTGEDLVNYEIYRKTDHAESWQLVGVVKSVEDNRRRYEWSETADQSATSYSYAIRSVNHYSTRSLFSKTVRIIVGSPK